MAGETTVIIGAGPAGLSAAHELVGQGIRPIVLEEASLVGGISRTEVYKGYRFDIGGHRFYTKSDLVRDMWAQTLGDDLLKVRRLSRIYYRDKFFLYPLNAVDCVGKLGIRESTLILLSYFKARLTPAGQLETFEQWVVNRFGRRIFNTFFRAYTEKVWGIACSQISADWASQRIGKMSLWVALRNALFGGKKIRSLVNEFEYPVLGPGMMWEAVADSVSKSGGQVRLGCRAVSLQHAGGRVNAVTVNGQSHDEQIDTGQVISSMPLGRLISALDPAPPKEVTQAASAIGHRAFILVALIVDQADLFPDNWIYVHSPNIRVGRIQNFKNWSRAMVPDPSKTCLGMEYFCQSGDDLWTMSDASVQELAGRELGEMGLARARDVVDSAVLRQPMAYPVYSNDYARQVGAIRRYLDTFENLQTIGRNGMHRYNNQDHSMLTGILAARNTLGQSNDVWSVNTDGSYGESITTADQPVYSADK